MGKLDEMLGALNARGVDSAILDNQKIAHLVASGHRILSARQVPGLTLHAEERSQAIVTRIRVAPEIKIAKPVHLCFGLLQSSGRQQIKMDLRLEEGAEVEFIAHCFFPYSEQVQHFMDAVVEVGAFACMRYTEGHFHGPFGGIEVVPKAQVKVGPHGRYLSDFSLTTGRVGKLDIDYTVEADEEAITEMTARVFGHKTDTIRIREKVVLAGKGSRGLIKTRLALEDDANAEISGITEGNAEGARGHVDCMEIVKDRAIASAIPIVKVKHPKAKVTHEAAIGSVDKHQLETLMAHGLSPEEAVEMIVSGLLR